MKTLRSLPLVLLAAVVGCGQPVEPSTEVAKAAAPPQTAVQQTPNPPPPREPRVPGWLSQFDWNTTGSIVLGEVLKSLVNGEDPNSWTMLSALRAGFGKQFDEYLNAQRIRDAINGGMSISGQPLGKLSKSVEHCARVLRMRVPDVRVFNEPTCVVSYMEAGDRGILSVSSGMLKLFEKQDGELRFFLGREMARSQMAGSGVVSKIAPVVTSIKHIPIAMFANWAPAGARDAMLYAERSLTGAVRYCREVEFSLDRAGALCCDDPDKVFDALARMLSGVDSRSDWLDPRAVKFNADAVLKSFDECKGIPALHKYVADSGSDASPFIPERMAALKRWFASGSPESIFNRSGPAPNPRTVKIDAVNVKGVGTNLSMSTLSLKAWKGSEELFRTVGFSAADYAKAGHTVTWYELNTPAIFEPGRPLILEIHDRSFFGYNSLIGQVAVFLPLDGKPGAESTAIATLNPDWESPEAKADGGTVEVVYRVGGKDAAK